MPGDPYRKVQAGERLAIPAEAYNAFVDAARFVRAKRHDQEQRPLAEFRQSGIVRVRNDSGSARARLDVLGIDAPIISPSDNLNQFKSEVALSGVVPAEPDHVGRFVVLLEPLGDGAIGRTFAAGVCPVKVDVVHEAHRWADVADGEAAKLKSSHAGAAEILWKESGTGENWAVVRLGPFGPANLLGKTDDAIDQGASGDVSIYIGQPGSEEDSGVDVEARSPLGSVEADRWVWLAWNGFGWYVVGAEC